MPCYLICQDILIVVEESLRHIFHLGKKYTCCLMLAYTFWVYVWLYMSILYVCYCMAPLGGVHKEEVEVEETEEASFHFDSQNVAHLLPAFFPPLQWGVFLLHCPLFCMVILHLAGESTTRRIRVAALMCKKEISWSSWRKITPTPGPVTITTNSAYHDHAILNVHICYIECD